MANTEWDKTSINLHPDEAARKNALMARGYSLRVLFLMGMDAAERQAGGGTDVDVPDRALQAVIRSAAETAARDAVRAALGEPVPERERRRSGPAPRDDGALIEAAREKGFGPDTPLAEKIAEAVRLSAAGATNARIGDLFGVTPERVRQWKGKRGAAEGDARLRAARNRAGVPPVAFLDSAAGAP
jgi:hypothetical protein